MNRSRAVRGLREVGLSLLLSACVSAPPPDSTASQTASVKACTADALKIDRLGGDAGMGHRALAYAFTNTSANKCSLKGYAAVTPLDAKGQPVTSVNLTHATGDYLNPQRQLRSLDLAPGQQVWFEIGYSVIPHRDGACPSVQQLQVRAPGASDGATFTQPMSPCDGIQVLPLQVGAAPY